MLGFSLTCLWPAPHMQLPRQRSQWPHYIAEETEGHKVGESPRSCSVLAVGPGFEPCAEGSARPACRGPRQAAGEQTCLISASEL